MALRTPEALEAEQNSIDTRYREGLNEQERGRLGGVYAKHQDEINERRRSLQEGEQQGGSFTPNDGSDIQEQEQQESPTFKGPWEDHTTPQTTNPQKQTLKQRATAFISNKMAVGVTGGIVGGGLIGALIVFSILLPLKMFGLVSNITSAATAIPERVVQERTEFLMKRNLSAWLIRKAAGDSITDDAAKAVLCKNASIACSFTMTRLNNYFDNLYDLSDFSNVFIDDGGDLAKTVKITPKGRDGLGSFARSWNAELTVKTDLGKLEMQVAHIESNAEMKRVIKTQISQEMNHRSVITRFIARKALMKKYGVTNFRAFEKVSNTIADKRTSLKSSLIQNTIGRISPKSSLYLGCITGDATCDKLTKAAESKIDFSGQRSEESLDDFNRRQARSKEYEDILHKVGAGGAVGEDTMISKFMSNKLVRVGGGIIAIAGVVDMFMGALGSIGDGALESVVYDIRSNAYVAYALGDISGVATNIEKIKAGGDDVDADLMQLMAEQFENIEQSPVFQAENGLLTTTSVSDGGYKRMCDVDGEQKEVVITGSYVCPERELAPHTTQFLHGPWGETLLGLANVWNHTAGWLFDIFDSILGKIIEVGSWPLRALANVVLKATTGHTGGEITEEVFGKVAGWVIGRFIDIPALGDETTGDQNYDALSAGIWISQNGMMENSIDGGDLLGGGGRILSNEEALAIQTSQREQELENFNSQTYLARMFDTDLTNSFASKFLARIPMATFTNSLGILGLPSAAVASLSSTLTPASQAAIGPLNPHNIPLYGYTLNDLINPNDATDKCEEDRAACIPILTADPNIFTTEFCDKRAEAREKSYTLDYDKYPIKVYTMTNPCALEKMSVGNLLYEMGVTDDPNSFRDPVPNGSSGRTGGARISESQLRALIKEYGLPDPTAEGNNGWEALFKKLTDDPKASWAAGAFLAGEKNYMDKGGELKEYLNTAWVWFENGSAHWPDPYEVNCNDAERGTSVSDYCGGGLIQVAGYQGFDRKNDYINIFKKLYSDNELSTVLKGVVSNSDKTIDSWSYLNSGQKAALSRFVDLDNLDSVTLNDISPNKDIFDTKAQILTFLLGKDPNMAAALNSFAVTDDDVLAHIGSGEGCGPGWGHYICKPERQLMANMMMALWKYDSQFGGPEGGQGTGINSIWGGVTVTLGQEWGITDFSQTGYYDNYAGSLGVPGAHPGLDYSMPRGTKLYSPVSGTVVSDGGTCYFRDDNQSKIYPDAPCDNSSGLRSFPNTGELKIQINVGGATHDLILGHMSQIAVKKGDSVSPGQYVGMSGTANSADHVHVEYRIPNSVNESGQQAVDPRKYL